MSNINGVEKLKTLLTYVERPRKFEQDDIPFPQADILERCINIGKNVYYHGCQAVLQELIQYAFPDRVGKHGDIDISDSQVYYYIDAVLFLGWLEKIGEQQYKMTEDGMQIFSKQDNELALNFEIAKSILIHPTFFRTANWYVNYGQWPSKEEFQTISKSCDTMSMRGGELASSTYDRRFQTVFKWLEWIIHAPNSVEESIAFC